MATTFNLSPQDKQSFIDTLVTNINNPEAIRKTAAAYGATAQDLATVTGLPVEQVRQYFLNAGVPMGTLLTGDVQRTIGTEQGRITQQEKADDFVVEKAIGMQGDKIVVQQYDAYGTPTSTRLASPNTPEGKGWLQALGIVGGAIGLSSLPEISSLFGGAEAATAAGAAEAAAAAGGATIPEVAGTLASTAAPSSLAATASGLPAAAGALTGADLAIALGEGMVPLASTAAQAGAVGSNLGALGAGLGLGSVLPAAAGGLLSNIPSSVLNTAASTVANALGGSSAGNLLGNLIGSGANLAMVQDAADKLREQGKISQQEYNTLSTNLFNVYRDVGQGAGQALGNIAERASNMVGQFTPYGVSTNLVNTQVNPQTGQLESNVSPVAQMLMAPLGRAAIQSAQAAEMTDVDQLSRDYYNKLAALSAPGIEQQRLATEARMRAQGRLGLLSSTIDPATGRPITTSAPELLAQEQAIARQQLERELQSRQAALGERGTLLSQSQQAFAPLQQVSQQALQQAQLSGQLGQLAQAGRTAQTQAYLQPAMAGITQPLSLFAQGLPQVATTQRLGVASNLAAQQQALDALAVGRTNVANQVLGQNGANLGNLLSSGINYFANPNAAGNVNSIGFGTGMGYGNQDIGLFI
jgi:hypothetical protein